MIRSRIGVALAVAVLGACSCSVHSGPVRAFGTIEMDEIDAASLVGGRIVQLRVDEGDSVRAGDTLAVLDRGEVLADLDASSAQAARAVAQWRDLSAGPRPPEIESARAALQAEKAQAKLAAAELARTQKLFDQNVLAQADLDKARTASESAEAQVKAQAQQLALLESGYRHGQIAAAEKGAEAAKASAASALTRAQELTLVAPVAGVVLLRNFVKGELVPAGSPVVTLGNPERLWVRCYVGAPDLPRVHLGDPAEIRVEGLKRPARGRVVEIATEAEFTPRAALTEDERANMVFGVKVELEPSAGTLKAGLPAEVHILAGAGSPQAAATKR